MAVNDEVKSRGIAASTTKEDVKDNEKFTIQKPDRMHH